MSSVRTFFTAALVLFSIQASSEPNQVGAKIEKDSLFCQMRYNANYTLDISKTGNGTFKFFFCDQDTSCYGSSEFLVSERQDRVSGYSYVATDVQGKETTYKLLGAPIADLPDHRTLLMNNKDEGFICYVK